MIFGYAWIGHMSWREPFLYYDKFHIFLKALSSFKNCKITPFLSFILFVRKLGVLHSHVSTSITMPPCNQWFPLYVRLIKKIISNF